MSTVSSPISPSSPAGDEIARNVAVVRARVAAAAARVDRLTADVTVVAVSKTVPLERLRSIATSSVTDLGENRVQEAAAKVAGLGDAVTWHLIGHLQSNKARVAVQLFDLIHSVDAVDLAVTLDRYAAALGKRQRVLFQVNVSGEESKGGFTPGSLREAAIRLAALPHLQPEGLMTIAPLGADDESLRGVFHRLRELREDLAPAFAPGVWRHLSMGMTDDYEIAVEEGATLVRVGRAIFGARPAPLALPGRPTVPTEGKER